MSWLNQVTVVEIFGIRVLRGLYMETSEDPVKETSEPEPVASLLVMFNPFKPQYHHAYSPHWPPFMSHDTCWEKLLKHQVIL